MGRLLSRLGNNGLSPLTPSRPQVIAANCAMPTFRWDGTVYSSDAKTSTITRKAFRTGRVACTNLQSAYCMFFDNGSAGEAALGNSFTADPVVESAIEPAFAVTAHRAFLDGAVSAVINDRNSLKVSSPVPYYVPAGSDVFVRTQMTGTAATVIPCGGNARTGAGDVGYRFTGGNTPTRVFGAGYINQNSGGVANDAYFDAMGPFLVLGVPAAPLVSVALMGDSFGEGQDDNPDTTTGVKGYMQRGLWSVNGHAVPSVNLSKGSETAQNQTIVIGSRKRSSWPFVTHLLCALGRNDVATGRTLSQVQNDLTAIWTAAKAVRGPYGRAPHVTQVLLPPSTTSTDSWATAANQTPTTGFAAGGVRDQLNAWIASQVGQGLLDAIVNPNLTWEDQANPGKWASTGAANYATADGIHPSAAMHLAASAAITAWAQTLTP